MLDGVLTPVASPTTWDLRASHSLHPVTIYQFVSVITRSPLYDLRYAPRTGELSHRSGGSADNLMTIARLTGQIWVPRWPASSLRPAGSPVLRLCYPTGLVATAAFFGLTREDAS